MGSVSVATRSGGKATLDAETVEAFGAGLRGGLVTAGDESYDEVRALWNAMIDRRPALIARCAGTADVIPIRGLDAAGLAALNGERALSLDPEELLAIQAHFTSEGRPPTDVELEMLAQTWSEHCGHKTFRSDVSVRNHAGELVDPVFIERIFLYKGNFYLYCLRH